MRAPFATAVAIGVGLVILLGYFLPIPILQNARSLLLDWAVILSSVALLVAIFNLFFVHFRRLAAPKRRDYYSLFLIIGFVMTLVIGLIFGSTDPQYQRVVTSIQMPIEASLMAILALSLAYASLRLFQRRSGVLAVIFAISAVVFLILFSGLLSVGNSLPLIREVTAFLQRLPVAGARGILLGIALGSLTTGLRVLLAADRPYSG